MENSEELCRKAYILKNLDNLDTWIGDIVHRVIKWILESKISASTNSLPSSLFEKNKDISLEEALSRAKKMLKMTWEQSRSQAWRNSVKSNLNLFEHYYKYPLSNRELKPRLHKVIQSIKNLYAWGLVDSFSRLPKENFLRIDELDSFELEGVKIFAIQDFALHNEEYLLYDWKTGKPHDKDVLQLSCYALYAINKWKAQPKDIKIIPVYLTEEECSCSPIAPLDVESVAKYIRDSVEQMRSILSDVKNNKADATLCVKTENPRRCGNCRFKEICE